ncbi:transcription factor GTE4-like isoform X2 [Salvia splendens]|uniref:transcription factor GTE4-like isoform X2 n=1 Tax=Salvia splendens TaxID=180675 RepID=UPI001C268621|nr:transcription factor GTE4-like isoform X2 [Salvia splendens]
MLGGGNEGSEEDKLMERKVYSRRPSFKGLENSHSSTNLLMDQQQQQQQQLKSQDMVSDGLNSVKRMPNSGVDVGGPLRQDKVRISLSKKSKRDALELRRKLESERDMVRSLIGRIESNEGMENGGKGSDGRDGDKVGTPRMVKPLNPLSVLVNENSKPGNDVVEKEKRTPKANKLYRNTDFLLAKDKIPLGESNKKLKSNGKKGGGGSGVGMENFPSHILKNCNALLERLMKHKHGWVFNKPVDAVALGLHDYFEIIRNPMDLGTVKGRLNQNWYKSPMEFAEDVVRTFQNAMTYNPKGQDVYVMAEQLCKIFEDKWAPIEAEYKRGMKLAADYDVGPPTPTSRKASQKSRERPDMKRPLDRPAMGSSDPKRKKPSSAQSGKVHAPKKPKAKDPNKREMTYDEKQKLSVNLQELPSEKLENVVQIIKKRNPSVSQEDDEIEVDIDSVDTETLWELDRFITNYKKNLSKNKRKAEIVSNLIASQEQNPNEKVATSVVTETPQASKRANEEKNASPPVEVEEPEVERSDKNQGAIQKSSSSDSGSSSSDSDGESSSADGSDGEHSPKN